MEEQAFTQAVTQYQDTVYRIALNYCRNPADADDVTQNAFLRLLRHKAVFESLEHLRYWLIRVAVNESKRWLSSPARLLALRAVEYDAQPALQYTMNPEESDLYAALMELPAKYRIVLYLHYYEDYATAEIAKLLQLPLSTVTTRLQRGRAGLKKKLAETPTSERGSIASKPAIDSFRKGSDFR